VARIAELPQCAVHYERPPPSRTRDGAEPRGACSACRKPARSLVSACLRWPPLEAAAAALLASPWQVAIARQRAFSAFPAAFSTGSPSPQAPRPQCPRQSAITALAWCSEEDIDSLRSFAC
jgi:hypothetical protein